MLSELRSPVPTVPDLVRVIGVAGVTMLLVFVNVEIGTTIVLAAITVGVLVVAGTQAKHLIALAVATIVVIALAFQMNVVEEYQVERLLTVFDSGSVSEDARYNLEQSVIAVGSGGMFGRGFLQGSQTNLDYVPEQHTDFIFTVVGEEFGFFGSAFVLALFALLLWRAIRIAYLSKDCVRDLPRHRGRLDVRDPDLRERGHGDRHHADHRHPAAVPQLRGHGDAGELRGDRHPVERAHAPVQVTGRVTTHRNVEPSGPVDSSSTSPSIALADMRASVRPNPTP